MSVLKIRGLYHTDGALLCTHQGHSCEASCKSCLKGKGLRKKVIRYSRINNQLQTVETRQQQAPKRGTNESYHKSDCYNSVITFITC